MYSAGLYLMRRQLLRYARRDVAMIAAGDIACTWRALSKYVFAVLPYLNFFTNKSLSDGEPMW